VRHYQIYLIEEEIAQIYFGEESKLFQLFLEAEKTTAPLKSEVLQKQVDYITKPLDIPVMKQAIEEALQHRTDYFIYPNVHLLDDGKGRSQAKLMIDTTRLHISASGNYEAETTFFEELRKCQPSFLAMDFNNHRYGWLNPIKQANFIS
jgi:hypothetical protein